MICENKELSPLATTNEPGFVRQAQSVPDAKVAGPDMVHRFNELLKNLREAGILQE